MKGVVIPSEALVLSEAKELSAFPFLSSSTSLIEDPVSLPFSVIPNAVRNLVVVSLSLVVVAARSHRASHFPSFVRRGVGEVEAFAFTLSPA